jgi:glycosyltransferase involved in cell wall biosynthesis
MRIVAMLQVCNERRFIAGCIEHLNAQGVEVYLIDDGSTDETVAIAERYVGRGVIDILRLPGSGRFALREQCRRQERLADTLDADWLMHVDADEIRVSSQRGQSLAQALAEFDEAGFNAVNFLEFTFVPTREQPDHDHPDFQQTMRSYYPFLPFFPARLNAWKRQDGPVELTWSGGHKVRFDGLRMAPRSLFMRHYLFLSREHAVEKFVDRRFAEDEVADGWFGFRSRLRAEMIELPSATELRHHEADHLLDRSEPRRRHLLDDLVSAYDVR